MSKKDHLQWVARQAGNRHAAADAAVAAQDGRIHSRQRLVAVEHEHALEPIAPGADRVIEPVLGQLQVVRLGAEGEVAHQQQHLSPKLLLAHGLDRPEHDAAVQAQPVQRVALGALPPAACGRRPGGAGR